MIASADGASAAGAAPAAIGADLELVETADKPALIAGEQITVKSPASPRGSWLTHSLGATGSAAVGLAQPDTRPQVSRTTEASRAPARR